MSPCQTFGDSDESNSALDPVTTSSRFSFSSYKVRKNGPNFVLPGFRPAGSAFSRKGRFQAIVEVSSGLPGPNHPVLVFIDEGCKCVVYHNITIQKDVYTVKLDLEMDEQRARLPRVRKSSKGRLVQDAIAVCYQFPANELPIHQQQALAAYQGGFISIGKLAEVMGLHVLDLRTWLTEHGIAQNTAMSIDDHANA